MATDFSEYAGQAVAIVLAGTVHLEHESFGYNKIFIRSRNYLRLIDLRCKLGEIYAGNTETKLSCHDSTNP